MTRTDSGSRGRLSAIIKDTIVNGTLKLLTTTRQRSRQLSLVAAAALPRPKGNAERPGVTPGVHRRQGGRLQIRGLPGCARIR
jgi:hypothetical protein